MTELTKAIPVYLYQQYADDNDLQAFVMAYNALNQGYLDWFVKTPLAIYTNENINGALLDWIAAGIYGQLRPSLQVGNTTILGPLNTFTCNRLLPNEWDVIRPPSQQVNDDIFKRIITWNFYKGDGYIFSIPWLKRRIMRFLTGVNGTDPGISQTYPISVTFTGLQCNISIASSDSFEYDNVLIQAIDAGFLNLPFQFSYMVTIV